MRTNQLGSPKAAAEAATEANEKAKAEAKVARAEARTRLLILLRRSLIRPG
jgi:hypothetical protein